MRSSTICSLLSLCWAALAAQSPDAWRVAAQTIRLLPPDSFQQLPPEVRSLLETRELTSSRVA